VSRDEFTGPEPLFDRLDANQDGFVTQAEASQFRGPGAGGGFAGPGGAGPAARLKTMDKNGDGKVSRAEFAGPQAMFDRLDSDKDGFIAQDEAASFRGPGAGGPAAKFLGPGGGGPALPGAGGGLANLRPAARIQAMDKNGDGKVSRSEFTGPPQRF